MAFVSQCERSVVNAYFTNATEKTRPVDFINLAYSAKLGGLIDELKISPTIRANNNGADERYNSTQDVCGVCTSNKLTHGRITFSRGENSPG